MVDRNANDAGEDPILMVEVSPGVAVVYGDRIPEGFDLQQFRLLDKETRSKLDIPIEHSSVANLGLQALNGIVQAQGIVKLAPETLKALQAGATPLTDGGWNLGTLTIDGKFAASVRWAPAPAAATISVVASMGNAATLAAIQAQLEEVIALTTHNIELTERAISVLKNDHWAMVNSSHQVLVQAARRSMVAGTVADPIWEGIRGEEISLRSHWDRAAAELTHYVKALQAKRSHKERRQFLVSQGEAIVGDSRALLRAQGSLQIFRAMQAARLAQRPDPSARDNELLTTMVQENAELHREEVSQAGWLLDQLGREFSLMAELDGENTLPVGKRKVASREVKELAFSIQKALASMSGEMCPELAETNVPLVSAFRGEEPDVIRRALRYRLGPDEALIALAEVNAAGWLTTARDLAPAAQLAVPLGGIAGRAFQHLADRSVEIWLAMTSERLLILNRDDFKRYGAIQVSIPHTAITACRNTTNPPGLVIETAGKRYEFEFPMVGDQNAPKALKDVVYKDFLEFKEIVDGVLSGNRELCSVRRSEARVDEFEVLATDSMLAPGQDQ